MYCCSRKDLMALEAEHLLGRSNHKMHAGRNKDDMSRTEASQMSQIRNLDQEQRMVSLSTTDLAHSCLCFSYAKHTAH